MMKPRANVNWLMRRKTNLGFNLSRKKKLILFGPELILFPTTIFERQYFPSYRTSVRTARVPARMFGIYRGPLLYIQILFSIFEHQYRHKRSYTRAYTHPYERTHTHPTLRETEPAYHLENYEVTVGASSSMGTSLPIENTSPKILK